MGPGGSISHAWDGDATRHGSGTGVCASPAPGEAGQPWAAWTQPSCDSLRLLGRRVILAEEPQPEVWWPIVPEAPKTHRRDVAMAKDCKL